jgi:hypothetical protein
MSGKPEGLTIAPIGKGPLKRPRPRPTLTEENVENVWSVNLNKLVQSTMENIAREGPESPLSKNISWANKPNTTMTTSRRRKNRTTKRKNRKSRKTSRSRK